jgi:hypothetical protein
METSRASTLPTFKIGDIYTTAFGPKNEDTLVAEVLCQRSTCRGIFVVAVKAWWKRNAWEVKKFKGEIPGIEKGNKKKSRACPYCNSFQKVPKKPAEAG